MKFKIEVELTEMLEAAQNGESTELEDIIVERITQKLSEKIEKEVVAKIIEKAEIIITDHTKKVLEGMTGANPDQTNGINIVRRALEAPLRQIAENAGVDGAVVAGKVRESADKNFGFNAQTEEYGDMFKFGVIDPAKVTRTALEDAASVAGLLITTEAMVADKPSKEGAAGGGMPDMGGMGGMGGMM